MTKLLIVAATLGLAISSAAAACDFHQSASVETDEAKVASITADKAQNMSTPVAQPSTDGTPVLIEQQPSSETAD